MARHSDGRVIGLACHRWRLAFASLCRSVLHDRGAGTALLERVKTQTTERLPALGVPGQHRRAAFLRTPWLHRHRVHRRQPQRRAVAGCEICMEGRQALTLKGCHGPRLRATQVTHHKFGERKVNRGFPAAPSGFHLGGPQSWAVTTRAWFVSSATLGYCVFILRMGWERHA